MTGEIGDGLRRALPLEVGGRGANDCAAGCEPPGDHACRARRGAPQVARLRRSHGMDSANPVIAVDSCEALQIGPLTMHFECRNAGSQVRDQTPGKARTPHGRRQAFNGSPSFRRRDAPEYPYRPDNHRCRSRTIPTRSQIRYRATIGGGCVPQAWPAERRA